MVASVARGIDADIVGGCHYADATLGGGQLHPVHAGEVTLEFRVFPALARNGVVIVGLPVAVLWTFLAVLPYAVGATPHPLLALHLLLGVVEADA